MDLCSNYHVLQISRAEAKEVVMLEPLACGLHAVDRARFRVPTTVVVQGSGPIGLATLIAAREAGAAETVVVGAPQERLDVARKFGADHTICIDEITEAGARIEKVRGLTRSGLGADIVFEATGVPEAVPEGIEMLRINGQYITLGHFTDNGSARLNPFRHFTANQITLRGVWGSHQGLYIRAREIIESGRYALGTMVTHQVALDRLGEVMKQLATGYVLDGRTVVKAAVVP
jgi:threonine dehydrogenase-like Zn-dependent dehydrogenase